MCGSTEEERNKLFHSKVVSVICTILLSASDEATSAKPFFPINTVLAAMNNVPNQKDAQKNKELLWGQASCCHCHSAKRPALKAQQSLPSEQQSCVRVHGVLLTAQLLQGGCPGWHRKTQVACRYHCLYLKVNLVANSGCRCDCLWMSLFHCSLPWALSSSSQHRRQRYMRHQRTVTLAPLFHNLGETAWSPAVMVSASGSSYHTFLG